MDQLPFYLMGTGPNLIDQNKIQLFRKENPELELLLNEMKIELRTLDLGYFESFCYWILSQQISGVVAEKLIYRFRNYFGMNVTPLGVLETDEEVFKEMGLSRSKIDYIRNTARFFLDHTTQISQVSDQPTSRIHDFFGQIKGVGTWTINMFLIFNLGRMDIGAPKDLVVRKGLQKMYDLPSLPDIKQAENIIEKYGDLATIGTILAWAVMGE